jgi:hypothetical protein
MKKTFTVLLLFFISISLKAQINASVNEISAWYTASEQTVVPDSLNTIITEECNRKQIPDNRRIKYMTYFRVLCNTSLPLTARIKQANLVIENFAKYENEFPLEVVFEIKKSLLKQIK